MNKYLVRANELMDEMVADRRHFHRFPELTNELPETTKYVRAKLEEMGYEVDEICKCGLVAIAGGKKPGAQQRQKLARHHGGKGCSHGCHGGMH